GLVSASDARSIERACAEDVLDTRRHPAIVFTARVTRTGDDRATLEGTLALKGVSRPLTVHAARDAEAWTAAATIHQPDFGITPYRAFFGALKLRPQVRVT